MAKYFESIVANDKTWVEKETKEKAKLEPRPPLAR